MKKALVVLLILAVAGGLFAQELTWGGSVKTGLNFSILNDGIDSNDDDPANTAEDPVITIYSDDSDTTSRFDLVGNYTNKNYGVVFRLRTEIGGYSLADTNPAASPTTLLLPGLLIGFHQIYGWTTFLNDTIKVSAGIIDDQTWRTGGIENWGVNGNGVRFEVIPLPGLNLGLMLKVPTDALNATAKDFFGETAIGAKYESDLFSVAASVLLDGEGDGLTLVEKLGDAYGNAAGKFNPTTIIPVSTDLTKDWNKGLVFQAGVTVAPIPGLAISVEGRGRNMGDFAKYGWFWFNEAVSYTLLDDKLTVGVDAKQHIYGEDVGKAIRGDNVKLSPHLIFVPKVGYDILDNVNVGLEANIGLWKDVYKTELSFKPNFTYTIGADTKIVAFYNLGIAKWDFPAPGDNTETTHTIQVDLIWTF
jgi:hypothetical protein